MPKLLVRLMALVLVPCLIGDPVLESAFSGMSRVGPAAYPATSRFNEQALSAVVLAARHPRRLLPLIPSLTHLRTRGLAWPLLIGGVGVSGAVTAILASGSAALFYVPLAWGASAAVLLPIAGGAKWRRGEKTTLTDLVAENLVAWWAEAPRFTHIGILYWFNPTRAEQMLRDFLHGHFEGKPEWIRMVRRFPAAEQLARGAAVTLFATVFIAAFILASTGTTDWTLLSWSLLPIPLFHFVRHELLHNLWSRYPLTHKDLHGLKEPAGLPSYKSIKEKVLDTPIHVFMENEAAELDELKDIGLRITRDTTLGEVLLRMIAERPSHPLRLKYDQGRVDRVRTDLAIAASKKGAGRIGGIPPNEARELPGTAYWKKHTNAPEPDEFEGKIELKKNRRATSFYIVLETRENKKGEQEEFLVIKPERLLKRGIVTKPDSKSAIIRETRKQLLSLLEAKGAKTEEPENGGSNPQKNEGSKDASGKNWGTQSDLPPLDEVRANQRGSAIFDPATFRFNDNGGARRSPELIARLNDLLAARPHSGTPAFLQKMFNLPQNHTVEVVLVNAGVLGGNPMGRYGVRTAGGRAVIAIDEAFYGMLLGNPQAPHLRARRRIFLERFLHELGHTNQVGFYRQELGEELWVLRHIDWEYYHVDVVEDHVEVRAYLNQLPGTLRELVAGDFKYGPFQALEGRTENDLLAGLVKIAKAVVTDEGFCFGKASGGSSANNDLAPASQPGRNRFNSELRPGAIKAMRQGDWESARDIINYIRRYWVAGVAQREIVSRFRFQYRIARRRGPEVNAHIQLRLLEISRAVWSRKPEDIDNARHALSQLKQYPLTQDEVEGPLGPQTFETQILGRALKNVEIRPETRLEDALRSHVLRWLGGINSVFFLPGGQGVAAPLLLGLAGQVLLGIPGMVLGVMTGVVWQFRLSPRRRRPPSPTEDRPNREEPPADPDEEPDYQDPDIPGRPEIPWIPPMGDPTPGDRPWARTLTTAA